MTTALTKAEDHVDLGKLAWYSLNLKRVARERAKFIRLHDSSIELASKYLTEMPEAEEIKRLRREIRIATRGTPDTIGLDSVQTAGYVSMQTEMLYNAQSHMVKDAWRKLVGLVHPDHGGSTELYQLALSAYRLKDLTYLQDLFIQLQKDNVFWRCSADGKEYIETELKRPGVSLMRLRVKPEFQIAMLDRSGKPEQARAFASTVAQGLIRVLRQELHYLLTGEVFNPNGKEVKDGNDEKESSENHGQDRNDQDCGEGWSGQ